MFGGYRSDGIVFCFPVDAFVKLTEVLSEDNIIKALCGCIMDDFPGYLIDKTLALDSQKGPTTSQEGLRMR